MSQSLIVAIILGMIFVTQLLAVRPVPSILQPSHARPVAAPLSVPAAPRSPAASPVGAKHVQLPSGNWMMYVHPQQRYRIKYPPNWRIKVNCEGGTSDDPTLCLLSSDFEESTTVLAIGGGLLNGGIIYIYGPGFEGHDSAEDDVCKSDLLHTSVLNCRRMNVDNRPAWRRQYSGRSEVGVIEDGRFFLSLIALYTEQAAQDTVRVFDQVVSSLEFAQ